MGVSGMLGHKVAQRLAVDLDVWGTVREQAPGGRLQGVLGPVRILGGVTVEDLPSAIAAFRASRPQLVVNCIGVVRQRSGAGPRAFVVANAEFPHLLADLCEVSGSRLIHISTDCVFSGRTGGLYHEDDASDVDDVYGRTKALGEVVGPGRLTLRTSIIGWQLRGSTGLLEWLSAHRTGSIHSYRRAIFSGLSTSAMAEVIASVVDAEEIEGLFHVSSEPITKHDLISRIVEALGWPTAIEPVDDPVIDRSLDSSAFRELTGWTPPDWDEMVLSLVEERPTYERWRR